MYVITVTLPCRGIQSVPVLYRYSLPSPRFVCSLHAHSPTNNNKCTVQVEPVSLAPPYLFTQLAHTHTNKQKSRPQFRRLRSYLMRLTLSNECVGRYAPVGVCIHVYWQNFYFSLPVHAAFTCVYTQYRKRYGVGRSRRRRRRQRRCQISLQRSRCEEAQTFQPSGQTTNKCVTCVDGDRRLFFGVYLLRQITC